MKHSFAIFGRAAYLLPFLVLMASCSGHKNISKDAARSQLTVALSLASEAETLLDYVIAGRATQLYAQGHAHYLAAEADDALDEMKSDAEPDIREPVLQCRSALGQLHREILLIPRLIGSDSEMNAAKDRLRQIHEKLAVTKSSL
jgi:hypothetical protein